MPPPVIAWAHAGRRRRQNSPAPMKAAPTMTPNTTRPVSPIQSLSIASLRKNPAPMTKATAPTMASQLTPTRESQSIRGP